MKDFVPCLKKAGALFTAVILLTASTSCGERFVPSPKKEVSAYSSRSLKGAAPGALQIDGDYGTVEIYCTKGESIEYEAKSIIRGTGDSDKLEKKLKDFNIKDKITGSTARISFNYNGTSKNPADTKLELKVYIPQKTEDIRIKLDTGRIRMQDDLKCDVSLDLGYVNTEINRIKGTITMKAGMGDIRVGGGRLCNGTSIVTGMGNIRIRSEFLKGEHILKTGLGNVELDLPENACISLKASGNIKLNDFENSEGPIIINAESDIGEIVLRKTKEQL